MNKKNGQVSGDRMQKQQFDTKDTAAAAFLYEGL